ncbi:DUF4214 domain-containing protein [uncultured Pseudomonas sp.]|uniref:DUF4214 domain-containing protein n=1 Tax=uncultured Pseudomonas sp. TaxID=114707 RepID=UPI002587CB04|nr:DUF4214 domain-containing protein [uncultured Pseudomonas sp.]
MADGDVIKMLVQLEATAQQMIQEINRGDAAVAKTSSNIDRNLSKVDQAFDRVGRNAGTLQQAVSGAFSAIGAGNLAAAGSIAGLVALTNSTIDYAKEVKNLASLSNASVEEFQRYAYGAKSVGVEQEKLADIFKDTTDRVGEFLARGSGEMSDFFKEIAPKIGLTADAFKGLSGPQALQLYYSSLEKAGISQQQITTYMEQMADEASALALLLKNAGAGFKEFGDRAQTTGLIINAFDIDRLVKAKQSFTDLQATFTGVSRQIAVGLLPGIEAVTDKLANMRDNGAAEKIGQTIGFLAENVDILVAALGGKLAAAFTKFGLEAVASGYQATKAMLDSVTASKAAAIAKAEETAVTAQAAAARLRDASATLVSAKALEAETSARVAGLFATREQLAYQAQLAAGTADAARFSTVLTVVEKDLVTAKRASAKASDALAVATTAEAAARARDTAATVANTAAQTEAAAAKNLLARAAGGLVGLLGGPLGIASLAVGVGAAFLTMGANAHKAETDLGVLEGRVKSLSEKFRTLTRDQQEGELASLAKEQRAVAQQATSAFDDLASSMKETLSSRYGARVANEFVTAMQAASASGKPLSDVLGDLKSRFRLPADTVGQWDEQAGKISSLSLSARQLDSTLGNLRKSVGQNAVATTLAAGEMSEAGKTYLATLDKTLAGLEDNGNAVKAANRYISEHTELNDADKKAILDQAAAIDKQKAANQAATQATKDSNSATKEAETLVKNQAKALADFLSQAGIATTKAKGLADAYAAGKDSLYDLTLQQRVEEELLKTGAAAREQVTTAVKAQMDAEARRDINKATQDLQLETAALLAQGVATLQGTTALEAYNLERGKTEILAGRNAEALTEETAAYVAAMDQRNQALKVSQQLSSVEGIMDRLQPQAKLLRDYTKEVGALTKAMELDKDHSAQYAETLRLLGLEYEQNRVKATAWGQFTEGAVDRVDDAFADAWKNIGQGFDGFATNLKDGFKQLLAELAHMAITKPIIMQIGAALGVGGLSASQGVGAIGGSGGGGLNIVSLAQNAYSVYNGLTGVGSAIYGGYQVGGLSGAVQAGAGYYGNMLSNGANYVSGLFGGASGATAAGSAAASSAAGASAAGYTGQAYSTWAASQYASQAASNVASTISSYGPYFAAIAGALQGWQQSGFKGAVAGAAGAVGGMYAGAQIGTAIFPGIGTAIGGAIGAVAGAMFGSSLFGGQWQTKDAGISLGVEGGDLSASGFEFQKKKGGLFSKNKKRTVFSALDEGTQSVLDATFDAGIDQIQALYEQFGIDVSQSALDGLSVAATQISTKGKTTEELQKLIGDWFTGTFDSITDQINTAMGSQFRAGLTLDGLKLLLGNLISVNGMLDLLNVGVLKITPAGAYAAEALGALAGGMDKLTENVNGYYGAFFTEAEKQADTLAAVNAQFQVMGVSLPPLRQGYRDIVSAIDVSTAAGQAMFTSLTGLWETASSYYDILGAQNKAAKQAQSDMLSGAMGTLQRAVQRQQNALSAAYNAQAEGLNASLTTSQGVMSSLSSMANGLASALKTLQGQSDAAKAVLYQQAQATLVSAAAIARAGGSIAGLAGIDDALSTVTNNDASRYGNWEDFARDQVRSLVLIDELNSAADGQLDQAQASVKALQDQIALAKKQYDMESTKLQGQLDLAQAQIDGINGIDNRLLTVNEALAEILKAITTASPDGTGATNADSIIDAAYRAALGRSADAAGAAYWKQQLASGAVNSNNLSTAIAAAGSANAAAAPNQVTAAYASILGRMPTEADMAYWTGQVANGGVHDVAAAIKAAAIANGQIPAFANGGSYLGGLALVGERGPEVIDFNRPGQVFNARQTAGMLSSADLSALISEVQGLRQQTADMRGALSDIAKHTNGTRAAVQQQNDSGIPIVGTVKTQAVTA